MRLINIQKYIAFIKVIEYGSISKAAEHLNYAQSGISRMLQDLENECGTVLCERGRQGVKLTSDGVKLLPAITAIVEQHQTYYNQLEKIQNLQTGMIRIATFSSVATHLLPKIIKEFKENYPAIEFELLLGDYTEIEDWIMKGRVDFGFLRLPTKEPMDTIFLEKDELLVVLPTNHEMADKQHIPLSLLAEEPFMLLEKGDKAEISAYLQAHHVQPNVTFTTWDDYAIMALVEQQLGISILPQLILKRAPYAIISKSLEIPAYRHIGIGMRNEASISIAAATFIEYIKKHVMT